MALITARTRISRLIETGLRRLQGGGGEGVIWKRHSSVANAKEAEISPRVGWELFGVKDYLDYRRSLYGDITHKALLVDAVGTLLVPSQPMAQVCQINS